MKKVLCGIALIIIIVVGIIIVVFKSDNSNDINETEIERVVTKTVEVEGKEAKYTLLKNEDKTVYGIEFKNPDLMAQIEITKRGSREDIKQKIENDIYKFTEDGVYKLEIKTVDGTLINTNTFKVITQK